MEDQFSTQRGKRLQLSVDMRIVCIVLFVAIVAMLALWRPWTNWRSAESRTIEVTGQTTIKAEPDEYVFSPTYEFSGSDAKAQSDLANTKSKDIVTELKKLGLADTNIKTSISSYTGKYSASGTYDATAKVYTLSVVATVSDRDQANKIQDYLATTTPQGSVTPNATFSETKRVKVEADARDAATKDARSKADQTAKNLGFSVGKVKQVTDGQNFGVMPMMGEASGTVSVAADGAGTISSAGGAPTTVKTLSSGIMPGLNDMTYSVTVTYYIH